MYTGAIYASSNIAFDIEPSFDSNFAYSEGGEEDH